MNYHNWRVMIEFRELTVHMEFRYLWLKYVTGYDLNFHCAKSLKGEYSQKITPQAQIRRDIVLDEFPSRIVYLCGVAKPYNWSKNFHLALLESDGAEPLRISENNITVEVHNAIPLPITADAMNAVEHPKASQKAYGTCRNWWFAHLLAATGILDPGQ